MVKNFLFLEKTEPPSWNFWKYLIDPHGQVIQAYSPQINVRQVYPDIKKLLIKYNLIDKSEL
jgi:glutathione peroxidase